MPPDIHPLPQPRPGRPVRVYLSLRILPSSLWPAMVRRRGRRTLLVIDPRATRLEVAQATAEIMTPEESAIYCEAYRTIVRPVGCDALVCLYVPPSLRLAGEQPTQGGVELLRRHSAGEMAEELALLVEEMAEERAG